MIGECCQKIAYCWWFWSFLTLLFIPLQPPNFLSHQTFYPNLQRTFLPFLLFALLFTQRLDSAWVHFPQIHLCVLFQCTDPILYVTKFPETSVLHHLKHLF